MARAGCPGAAGALAAIANVETAHTQLRSNLDKARPLFYTEKGQRMLADVDTQVRAYEKVIAESIKRAQADALQEKRDSVDYLFATVAPVANTLDNSLTELTRLKKQNAVSAVDEATVLYESWLSRRLSTPWPRSTTHRRRSSTSSALSTASPSRPTSWP
jgi:hypothetical protein